MDEKSPDDLRREKWRLAKSKYRREHGCLPVNKKKDDLFKCGKCKQYKESTEYYRDSTSKHGITSYCKQCVRAAALDRYYSKNIK